MNLKNHGDFGNGKEKLQGKCRDEIIESGERGLQEDEFLEACKEDLQKENGAFGAEKKGKRAEKFYTKSLAGFKLNNDSLFNDLYRVANELGSDTVKYKEYVELGRYSERQFRYRFKTWNNALRSAGLSVSRQAGVIAPRDRRFAPVKLRYEVMLRDGFKCVICGRDASDGVKLVIDHIVPFAKGGKTVMRNLRTLCRTCNLGKSDSVL